MECSAHPGVPADARCPSCDRAVCDRCLTHEVDGRLVCEACGAREDDRARSLGSAILGFVGVGYLTTLALGTIVFRARPFVGGLAAVVAMVLWRALQGVLRPPTVIRRDAGPS